MLLELGMIMQKDQCTCEHHHEKLLKQHVICVSM